MSLKLSQPSIRWWRRALRVCLICNCSLVSVQSWTNTNNGLGASFGAVKKFHQSCFQGSGQQSWSFQLSATNSRGYQSDYPIVKEECQAFMENHEAEQQALLKRDSKIYILPIVVAFFSFVLFVDISHSFHILVDTLSLGKYKGELSEEIRPLINGPVTLTISILFGSLVSMTISTLYQRQTAIHQVGIATVNEAHHIQYLAEALPEPERSQVKNEVKMFTLLRLRTFFRGEMFAKQYRGLNLSPILLVLHRVGQNPETSGPYLGELYASLANLKQIWIDFVAATQKNFTPAHYANLLSQALVLLVIYLWETDDVALLEAHTFELRVAFAMLTATMAWIAAIIIDLSTPISNIITMIKKYDVDMDEMISCGLAMNLEDNKINGDDAEKKSFLSESSLVEEESVRGNRSSE